MFWLPLPYERMTIVAPLAVAEVEKRLMDLAESGQEPNVLSKSFWLGSWRQLMEGTGYGGLVQGGRFRLRRVLIYRNDLRPILLGTYEGRAHGTVIHAVLRPPLGALALMLCFLLLPVAMWVAFRAHGSNAALLGPGLLGWALYVLFLGAFKIESWIVRRDLRRAFAGRPAQPSRGGIGSL